MTPPSTVVLDLDGTLVDSVPVHVLAWQAAFRAVGVAVPTHRVHRAIGMGGDRLVAQVAGEEVERAHGDRLRELHPAELDRLFGRIRPAEGASALLATLAERGVTVVLASSSEQALTDRLLGLVDGADRLDRVITGSDAEQSKPDGELVATALASVGDAAAVLVGDAVWDVAAARDAGVPCVGVLTGGIGEAELRGAGAVGVHESAQVLAELLTAADGSFTPVHAWRQPPNA
ncbi:HAD family hydrolase [Nocardioides marinquilinus]|uniref:HAD family hydrolase n=1 Tax=Nocardioides marinquilinus TaxID=1210400 RepID=A0ABP9PBU1_9ACTN